MITEIKVILEYKCYPVWLYDENGEVIDTLLPDELRSDFEIDSLFDNIQSKYDALFIDNDKEFRYIGFENENDKHLFLSECKNAIEKLTAKCQGKYKITNKIAI